MESKDFTRKDFLKKITTATMASFGLAMGNPASLFASSRSAEEYPVLRPKSTVLFQGDSITDYGRNRDALGPNNPQGLGPSYPFIASSYLLNMLPDRDLSFFNRGVSGNKVFQLANRWQSDTLDLNPDILSILVGVNDYWHTFTNGYDGTLETYEHDYRALLDRTQRELPGVTLVIGEPYALKGGKAINSNWDLSVFEGYKKAARSIAKDYGAAFVPYQSIYDEAIKKAPVSYWSPDGVHPSIAGCQLMAHGWLNTVKAMQA